MKPSGGPRNDNDWRGTAAKIGARHDEKRTGAPPAALDIQKDGQVAQGQ